MEDILAIILILAGVALSILAAKRIYAYVNKRIRDHIQKKREAEEAEHKRQLEATRKWREGLQKRATPPSPPPPKYSSSDSSATTSSRTAVNVNNDDGFLGDLATMLVLNAALNHDSARASVNYDTNEIRVTTDNDIKPSSPSWSSWSSSDSSSSSSDSGPSSDW